MGRYRGYDDSPGNLRKDLEDLRALVKESLAAKRLARSSMGESGNLLIRGLLRVAGALDLTGTMSMKSAAGVELIRMGDMEVGDRGIAIFRENGRPALEVRKQIDGEYIGQSVAIYDAGGRRVIVTEDLLGGLRSPFFEHPFQPVAAATGTPVTCGPYGLERTTSSSAWETLFAYDGKRQNPFLDLKVAAVCSDGTTAGEVRIVDLFDADTPLPDFFGTDPWLGVIAAGTTSYAVLDPTPSQALTADTGAPFDYIRLGIQVRRTAGTGSITLAVPQSIGG